MTWQVALISGAFTLAGIVVTAIVAPVLVSRLLDRKITPKLDAVHQSTTVNHHSSPTPTILDRLEDLTDAVKGIGDRLEDGVERFQRIEQTVGLPAWPGDPAA